MPTPNKPLAIVVRALGKTLYALKVVVGSIGLAYVWWLANKIGDGEFLK